MSRLPGIALSGDQVALIRRAMLDVEDRIHALAAGGEHSDVQQRLAAAVAGVHFLLERARERRQVLGLPREVRYSQSPRKPLVAYVDQRQQDFSSFASLAAEVQASISVPSTVKCSSDIHAAARSTTRCRNWRATS